METSSPLTYSLQVIPIIDRAHADRMGIPREEFNDYIVMFIESLPKELTKIQSAFEKEDWRTFQERVHYLKGGASTVGVARLSEACKRLDLCLKQKELDNVSMLYQVFSDIAKELLAYKDIDISA